MRRLTNWYTSDFTSYGKTLAEWTLDLQLEFKQQVGQSIQLKMLLTFSGQIQQTQWCLTLANWFKAQKQAARNTSIGHDIAISEKYFLK